MRRRLPIRRPVRIFLALTVVPTMLVGFSAQSAVATGTYPLSLVQNCVAGLGWYGVVNTAKIEAPGSGSVTAISYATAEIYSSNGCGGGYSTTNLASCTSGTDLFINILQNDAIIATDNENFNGGTHQVSDSVSTNTPSGSNVAADSVVITTWGNSCNNQSAANEISPSTSPY